MQASGIITDGADDTSFGPHYQRPSLNVEVMKLGVNGGSNYRPSSSLDKESPSVQVQASFAMPSTGRNFSPEPETDFLSFLS